MDYNFHGGPGLDLGAISQAISSANQSGSAAAQVLAQAYGQAGDRVARGFELRAQRRSEKNQAEKDREARVKLEEIQQAEQTRRTLIEATAKAEEQRLGRQSSIVEKAIGEGYDPGELQQRFPEAFGGQQQGGGLGQLFGQGGTPLGPRGPGIGGQGGPGGIGAAVGGGASAAAAFAPPQQGFQGLKRRPTEAELSRQEKEQVADVALQIRRLQATGDKNVVSTKKVSLADALNLNGLDDFELEQAVLSAYPQLSPKVSLEGKEDRRALDAKIKKLREERTIQVPNGAGLTGLDWKGKDRRVVHAAMEEVYGQDYDIPVTEEESKAAAYRKLLGEYPEYVNRFSPAQVQRQELPEQQLLAQDQQTAALAPGGTATFNEGFLSALGVDVTQLPMSLQSASAMQYPVEMQGDRLVFKPTKEGTPVHPETQAALDELMKSPQTAARAGVKTANPALKMSPADLEKAGATRRINQPPAKQEQKAPPASKAAVQTPGLSAIEQYRASRAGKVETPAKKASRNPQAVPNSISLVGLDESALLRLLQSAGAVP